MAQNIKRLKKKILLLSDDLRTTSGIATMSKEFVIGTLHKYDWIQIGAAPNHLELGKVVDVNDDVRKRTGIKDANLKIIPYNSYGDIGIIRKMIKEEKIDAILLFTDPRYWVWLFQIENEIRKKIPIMYLNIWDDYPAPQYNEAYYESCDCLMGISKQTVNINKIVLGEKAKDKVIGYVPHGINHKFFFKITPEYEKYNDYQLFKKQILDNKEYEYVVFYNARNIRRKSVPDLIAGYKVFCDNIGPEKAKKSLLLLHTQAKDENGTDLEAVIEYLGDDHINIKIVDGVFSTEHMNWLYNLADVTCLVSSNEGWGLSLTESMMAGVMIIGNVTGGM